MTDINKALLDAEKKYLAAKAAFEKLQNADEFGLMKRDYPIGSKWQLKHDCSEVEIVGYGPCEFVPSLKVRTFSTALHLPSSLVPLEKPALNEGGSDE